MVGVVINVMNTRNMDIFKTKISNPKHLESTTTVKKKRNYLLGRVKKLSVINNKVIIRYFRKYFGQVYKV